MPLKYLSFVTMASKSFLLRKMGVYIKPKLFFAILLASLSPIATKAQCISRSANARCDTIVPTVTCVSGSPICFESLATLHLTSRILVDTVCVSFGDGQDTTFVPPDTAFDITHYYHFQPEDSCPAWNFGEPGINCDIRANFFKRCPLGYSFNYSQTSVSFRFRPRADLDLQHANYCNTDSVLILDFGCTNSYLNTDLTNYTWDYGDGTFSDTTWGTQFSYFNLPPHLYTTPGDYVIGLYAWNQCGIDSDHVIVHTQSLIDVQMNAPTPMCEGDTVSTHITGIGSNSYYDAVSNPSNGVQIINPNTPDPQIVFNQAGTFTVTFQFGVCSKDTVVTVNSRVDMVHNPVPDMCDNNGNNPLYLTPYYQTVNSAAVQSNHFWIKNEFGVVYSDTTPSFIFNTVNLSDTGLYIITDTSATICNTVYTIDSFYIFPREILNLPADTLVCLQTVYILPSFPGTTVTVAGEVSPVLNDTIVIDSAKAYRFVYQPSCGNSDTLTITGQGISFEAYDSFYCAHPGNITLTASRPNIVFSGRYVSSSLGIMYGDSSASVLNPFYASYTDPSTGCVFLDSAVITIATAFNPVYALTDSACVNSIVQFNYADTTLNYIINWGDGTIDSNITHIYTSAGTKYVAVTFSDSVCNEVHNDSVVIVAQPPAFFSVNPDTLCFGDTSFINFTPDPQYSYSWTYAGQTTTTPPLIVDTSTVNAFLTVPVTLSVTSAYCPVENYTDNTHFNRAVLPVINLNYDSTCSPLAITIINNSALYPAADFYWYKNNVLFSTSSTLQQFDTLYADQTDSAYTFKLVVYSCNRWDSSSETVIVHQANFAPVIYADTFQNCMFDTFHFSSSVRAGCVVTYDFGDGSFTQPLPTDSVVAHAYDTAGDYTVNLIMHCECKIRSDNLLVHVNPAPVISVSAPSAACADTAVAIISQNTGYAAGGYLTSFGDGTYDLFASNPVHAYAPGSYSGWMTARGTNGCRSDTARFNIVVSPTPNANLSMPDSIACNEMLVNLAVDSFTANSVYQWSVLYNNQVTTSTTFNGAFQLYMQDAGTHYVFLDAYSSSNQSCIAHSDTLSFTVNDGPQLQTSVPPAGCTDSVITVNSQTTGAAGVYETYFGDGTYNLSSPNPPHAYSAAGSYNGWMLALGTNGCPSDTSYFHLIIYRTPSADMPPIDTSSCAAVLTLFSVDTVMANSVYEWSILYNNQVTNVTTYDGALPLYAGEPGEHLIFLTAYNANHSSCVAYSDTFRVTVFPSPEARFSIGAPFVFNSVFSFPLINLSTPQGNTYIWDFGDNTFSNEVNPAPHGYKDPGTYTITLIARNGPCEDTAEHSLEVNPYLQLFVPNVFTPNNDGVNDFFELFGNRKDLDYLHVKVFDRLGEKVFESFDNNFKWDGVYQGKPLQPAVFVYLIEVSSVGEADTRLMKGSVTLLR